jgi:hypothetical protein
MRRKLFTLAAGVSAVLCVGACGLWIRSYWRADQIDMFAKGSEYRQRPLWMATAISAKGGLGVSVSHSTEYFPDDASWRRSLTRPTAMPLQHESWGARAYPRWAGKGITSTWQGMGFQWLRRVRTEPDLWAVQRSVVVPLWVAALLTAALPALWLSRRLSSYRAARRARLGLCLACGYDLRATPDRCPECGAAVPAKGVAA